MMFLLISVGYSCPGFMNCQMSLCVGSIWHQTKFYKNLFLEKLSITWQRKTLWLVGRSSSDMKFLEGHLVWSSCQFVSSISKPLSFAYSNLWLSLAFVMALLASSCFFFHFLPVFPLPLSLQVPYIHPQALSHFTSHPSLQRLIHLVLHLPRSSRHFYPGTWAAVLSNLATREFWDRICHYGHTGRNADGFQTSNFNHILWDTRGDKGGTGWGITDRWGAGGAEKEEVSH